jgi:DNA-binding transcriptional MerR regulator
VTGRDEQALRTIGEVAESLDLPPHVLRFWETRFEELDPVKRAGGRRYYRPRDVELLFALRHLLYGQGYTIKGVQRLLQEQGARALIENLRAGRQPGVAAEPPAPAPPPEPRPSAPSPREPLRSPEPRRAPEPPPEPPQRQSAEHPMREGIRIDSLDFTAVASPAPPPATHLPAVVAQPYADAPRLGEEDIRQLRLALADLSECRRLLRLTKE